MKNFFRAIILFALLISADRNEETRQLTRSMSATTHELKGGGV